MPPHYTELAMLLMITHPKDCQLLRSKPDLEREGFAVDMTHDAAEGDRKVRSLPYETIVFDPRLPGPDGLRLIRDWRADGIKAELLLLTARDNCTEMVRGLDMGADACLPRPFHIAELLARLRVFRRRRTLPAPPRPLFRIHDLEIDPGARTVRRSGSLVPLFTREFTLLEFLVHHQGKIVTRPMIRSHLNIDGPHGSNVVDVHISGLRRKIDGGRQNRLIETCWGRGYMMRADAGAESPSSLPSCL
jgi:DNA-binding response OmpR family regulator